MGISVIPWTVNNRESMHKVISAKVDGLISDDVDLMMDVVKEEVQPGQGVCF
jgi:glycerophosphoryl diester phosphodiesterase